MLRHLVRAEVDRIVGLQLAAFAAGDYEQALTFATPDFRRNFSPRTFEEMIVTRFPIPAEAESHRLGLCASSGVAVVVVVEVMASAGSQTLQYVLEDLDGRWLIGGAVPLDDPSAGMGPVI